MTKENNILSENVVKNTTPATEPTSADSAAPETSATKSPTKKRSKKVKRHVPSGQMHIQATFNNTIISFTDPSGGVLAASSAGACGFRGSKKGTAYAAQIAVDKAAESVKNTYGLNKIAVFVKGVGLGRDAAIRASLNHGMIIDSITDVTGIPHGGVRPKKVRRA
jgi:small subunit ribosomal protein S11